KDVHSNWPRRASNFIIYVSVPHLQRLIPDSHPPDPLKKNNRRLQQVVHRRSECLTGDYHKLWPDTLLYSLTFDEFSPVNLSEKQALSEPFLPLVSRR
ncbi:23111_t:CDS:2, partial [Racocetra persica]